MCLLESQYRFWRSYHQKQNSIFSSISGFANRVLRRYLQYARVPPASLRPRFNIMNSLAAHGNAGSHYVIGQYKRGCSGYTHKYLLSRISYLVSLELTALVTLYDSSLSPQGTRDELLGGVTFPLRSRHLNVISLWGYRCWRVLLITDISSLLPL